MEIIAGYTLISKSKTTFYKGDIYYFRHNKTGARICYCDTEDKEKRFQITFKTMALNNRGAAHILEHSILAQSQKYPVKNPYLEMDTRSVNTAINATTYSDHTCFYCATYNEKDLQNLMEVLSNCVFYPAVIQDERIFHQEGFRKELDENGHLHYNGIVYNEMMGDFEDPDFYFGYQLADLMLPKSLYSYISGGSPLEIPKLTYPELCDFYHKNYHPSRAYIHLYGHMDIKEKLTWLDKEIFSKFDKLEGDVTIPVYPANEKREVVATSPATMDDDTCGLIIGFELPFEYSPKTSLALSELLNLAFLSTVSPFYQKFVDANLASDVQFNMDSYRQTTGFILLSGIDVKNQDVVIKKVKEFFADFAKQGFDHQLLKSSINRRKFDYARHLDDCPNGYGEDFINESLRWWIYDDNCIYYDYDTIKLYDELSADIDHNYYEDLFKKIFLNPEPMMIAFFKPDHDFLPKIDEQRRNQIAFDEANMTPEERAKLLKESRELNEYLKVTATKEELDTLPSLALEDLDISLTKIMATQEGKDYHVFMPANNIVFERILFDISDLSQEELCYLSALGDLFSLLNREHFTRNEMNKALIDAIGNQSSYTRSHYFKGNKEKYYFILTANGYKESFPAYFKLVYQYLTTIIFDEDRIKYYFDSTYKSYKDKLIDDDLNFAMRKALCPSMASENAKDCISGFTQFFFLKEIKKNYDSKKIIQHLKDLVDKIFVKDRISLLYIGDEENYEMVNKAANDFRNSFKESHVTLRYLPEPEGNIHNIGYYANRDVNCVAFSYHGKALDMKTLCTLYLTSDYLSQNYLAQAIRIQGGAYSWGCGCSVNGEVYFYSTQDPHINKTLSIFKGCPQYLREHPIDDDLLIQFKMKNISAMQDNHSIWSKGNIALKRLFRGNSDNPNALMKEYFLAITKEDIIEIADYIEEIVSHASLVVIGNKKSINKHKELFDEIVELKL